MSKKFRKLGSGIEQMEEKAMMTGDVGVIMDGFDMTLVEANVGQAQQVEVQQFSNGTVRVSGIGDTDVTYNGQTRNFFDFWRVDSLDARLGGGNDELTINHLDTDGMDIRMGSGHDVLEMNFVDSTDDVYIRTEGGNDDVIIDDIDITGAWNDLRIYTGSGNDDVVLDNADVSDDIVVRTYDRSYMNETDTVVIRDDSDFDDLYAYLGAGNDILLLDNNDFDRVYADLGGGNDQAFFHGNFGTSVSANGSSGNDDLTAGNNTISHFKFEGGSGYDEYFQVQNNQGKDSNNFGKLETPSATTKFV